jgi:hypothetical protein
MSGGHCEGMAVTASLFYFATGPSPAPDPFGANTVPGLSITNNNPLQREIAYGFAFQWIPSVEAAKVAGTPSEVLAATQTALANNEPIVLGFYMPDKTGGHAVTPIYVADRGDGVFDLVIYDNNFPNALRSVVVDTNTDSWNYLGGTNPSAADETYTGDANTKTLELERIQPGLGVQPCPFCAGAAAERKGANLGADVEVIWRGDASNGRHGDLRITDAEGNEAGSTGTEDGLETTNEIPGAVERFTRLGGTEEDPVFNQSPPPHYLLPNGEYKIELAGGDVQGSPDEGVSIVRDGVFFAVDNVELKDGEKQLVKIENDELVFNNEEGETESAKIRFGYVDEADYTFRLGTRGLEEDASVSVDLIRNKEELTLRTKGDKARYTLEVVRANGEVETLTDEKIKVKRGDAVIDYGKWREGDDSAPIDRDK